MHPFITIATQAARSASRVILRFFDQLDQLEVTEKNRNDLVTQVDKMSEEEIISHIRKAYPNHSIIGEEGGADKTKQDEYTWIIDPLDGTANYVHGFPHFCISIAVKRKDMLEVACIYDPIRQELFTAAKGRGAQLNNKRIRVSSTRKLEHSLVGTGFPFRQTELHQPYLNTFNHIFPQTADIRRAGAAALDLAYVACGRLDAFWEMVLAEWDMAAGALLIQEAGGVVSDLNGNKDFLKAGNIIAGNTYTHKALFDLVSSSAK